MIIRFLLIVAALMGGPEIFAGTIKGKVTLKGKKTHANAVIYIDRIPGKTFKAPRAAAQMDQKNLEFVPHVLPVLAGTKVEFLNNDDVLHHVYTTEACAEQFDLGRWEAGKSKSYTFKTPGCQAVLLCDLHPAMEAYVVVVETPYFATSAKDGSYIIKDVPPGKYTLKVWHKAYQGRDVSVEISADGDTTIDFEMTKGDTE